MKCFLYTEIAILLFPCCQFGDPMQEREDSEIYCWCKFEGIEFAEVFSMVRKLSLSRAIVKTAL
jgi:glutathione peroxidase-family protein